MCRNIQPLFNLDPPASEAEIRAASLQFVRKISGFDKPSVANRAAFLTAVDAITKISHDLLLELQTSASPRNRAEEAARRRARATKRVAAEVKDNL